MNSTRPQKPEVAESLGFTDKLWGIVQCCWLADASGRPDMRTVPSEPCNVVLGGEAIGVTTDSRWMPVLAPYWEPLGLVSILEGFTVRVEQSRTSVTNRGWWNQRARRPPSALASDTQFGMTK